MAQGGFNVNEEKLINRIQELTILCTDDGREFVRTDRLDITERLLAGTDYSPLATAPLARVYAHKDFQADRPMVLVSNHVDSIYYNHFTRVKRKKVEGTFDNSACNGIMVQLMLEGRLPAQVLVAFTGNEECQLRGVDQTVALLESKGLIGKLEMVVSLDLTEDFPGEDFTVENCFVQKEIEHRLPRYRKKRHLKRHLRTLLPTPRFVKGAEQDESWQYDEYDLNCFSLCLPCRLLGKDMHSDEGVAIKRRAITGYARALARLLQGLDAA